jgi:hypothetical protein
LRWFLTSFAVGADYVQEMDGMLTSFREHNPGVPTVTGCDLIDRPQGDPYSVWSGVTRYKAEWLRRTWGAWSHLGAMLWLDADARVRRPIQIPESAGPFALKTYDTPASGTMLFRDGCESLLDEWEALAGDPAYTTDELSLAEAMKRTGTIGYELPDSLSSVCSRTWRGYAGELQHDSAIVHWNRSRLKLGKVPDWPPSESERAAANPPESTP